MRRRGIAGIVAALIIGAAGSARAKCNTLRCGDLNDDCKQDIGDVVRALRGSVGLDPLDDVARHAADVAPCREIGTWNGIRVSEPVGDGAVTVADVVVLLRASVRLEAFQPCFGPVVQSVEPTELCTTRAMTVLVRGSGLYSGCTIDIGGQRAEISESFSGAVRVIVPPRTDVDGEGRWVDVVARSSQGIGMLPGAAWLKAPCDWSPTPERMEPATGAASGRTSVIVMGQDLGCVSAGYLEQVSSGTIIALTDLRSRGDSQLGVTVPPLGARSRGETFDLVLTSGCGLRRLADAWTYRADTQPWIASLSPPSGPWRGGEQVTCLGDNLQEVTAVEVGGVRLDLAAGDFGTSRGELRIFSMPPSPDPERELHVGIVPFVGGVAGYGAIYRYGSDDVISCTDIIETSGPVAGGTFVSVAGDALDDVERFLFGDVAAPAVVLLDEHRALVVLPAATRPGDVRIGLERAGVVVHECDESFTYE